MFLTLKRILDGDCIWFMLGGFGSLLGFGVGWLYALALKMPWWVKLIVGLLLALLCVLLVHEGFERFMVWYTTPLNTPLRIDTH